MNALEISEMLSGLDKLPSAPPGIIIENDIRKAPKEIASLYEFARVDRAAEQNITRIALQANYAQITFVSFLYLPYDPNRNYLIIQNHGAGTMYIDFSGNASPGTSGIQLISGGYYEPFVVPKTSVAITGTGVVEIGTP